MNPIRRVAGQIWAVYGLLVFFVLVLLFFPFYLLFLGLLPRRFARVVIRFNHHVFPYIFFTLVGIRLKVHGRELLRKGEQYIIISNHRSAIDFVANPVAFPGLWLFLAKKELTRVPLLGFLVKRLCVLVDRKDPASAARSLEWLKKAFSEGFSVFIYPEGTRNRGDQPLGPFFSGAFRLSRDLDHPIAVLTLCNVHRRSGTARALDLWPGTLHLRWSGILHPGDYPSHQAMMDAARDWMLRDLHP